MLKAVQRHTDLPWVVLYVSRWLHAPMQLPDGTLQRRETGEPRRVGYVQLNITNLMNSAGLCAAPAGKAW